MVPPPPPLLQTFVAGPLLQTLVAGLCVEYCTQSSIGLSQGRFVARPLDSVTSLVAKRPPGPVTSPMFLRRSHINMCDIYIYIYIYIYIHIICVCVWVCACLLQAVMDRTYRHKPKNAIGELLVSSGHVWHHGLMRIIVRGAWVCGNRVRETSSKLPLRTHRSGTVFRALGIRRKKTIKF